MRYGLQNSIKLFFLVVLMPVLMVLSLFGNNNLAAGDNLSIKTIRPVPGYDSRKVNLDKKAKRHFQIIGTVDFIGDGYIVVDDSAIKTAPRVKISDAFKGKYVEIRLDDNGHAARIQRINNPE